MCINVNIINVNNSMYTFYANKTMDVNFRCEKWTYPLVRISLHGHLINWENSPLLYWSYVCLGVAISILGQLWNKINQTIIRFRSWINIIQIFYRMCIVFYVGLAKQPYTSMLVKLNRHIYTYFFVACMMSCKTRWDLLSYMYLYVRKLETEMELRAHCLVLTNCRYDCLVYCDSWKAPGRD